MACPGTWTSETEVSWRASALTSPPPQKPILNSDKPRRIKDQPSPGMTLKTTDAKAVPGTGQPVVSLFLVSPRPYLWHSLSGERRRHADGS